MNIFIIISRVIGLVLYLPFAAISILSYGIGDGFSYWRDRFNCRVERVCPRCGGKGRIMETPTVGGGKCNGTGRVAVPVEERGEGEAGK